MLTALNAKVKANLPPESLAYKSLAFIFNYRAWRAAYMRLLKDSRFNEDESFMASAYVRLVTGSPPSNGAELRRVRSRCTLPWGVQLVGS